VKEAPSSPVLRNRNLALLWLGQLVSLTGSWMQSVAQGWLVLRMSDSTFQLGLVGFCSYAPVLLLALLGGAAADRLPRRKALLVTQATAMALSAVLAALTWTGSIRVWHVALLALGLPTEMLVHPGPQWVERMATGKGPWPAVLPGYLALARSPATDPATTPSRSTA